MEKEAITQEELIAIYNICKKRLTISLEDFLNNSKYEEIKNLTVKRYNSLDQFIKSLNAENFGIFKENVCVEFGNDNFTDENIYAYYVDRIQEMLKMYKEVELNKLYVYCLKDKKLRNLEIKNSELINKDNKKVKLNGLYDYLLKETSINKDKFLKLNDEEYEFERELILTIDSNINNVKEFIIKLDEIPRTKFMNSIKEKYHLTEVNGYYVCRYLFDNFRMIKLLDKNVGYKRLKPNDFMDIFKCSLNVKNVTTAFKYAKQANSKLIKNVYLELKDNEYFKELTNLPKDNLGITFTAIKVLGKGLEEVESLNKYLGFMNKITLSKYVLTSSDVKKQYLKEAVLFYKKKVLKGTNDGIIKFINNIGLFTKLSKEDKNIILNNYKEFVEEVFDLAYEAAEDLDYRLIDDLIYYVSNKLIQYRVFASKGKLLNVNKLDFIKCNDYLLMNNSNNHCHKLEEIQFNNKLDLEDKVIKEWKEQLLLQYKTKHNDNSYEFFSALYDLLSLYERKTGKKYDPRRCLFSYEDVYNYYYMSDEERRIYENELIIEE